MSIHEAKINRQGYNTFALITNSVDTISTIYKIAKKVNKDIGKHTRVYFDCICLSAYHKREIPRFMVSEIVDGVMTIYTLGHVHDSELQSVFNPMIDEVAEEFPYVKDFVIQEYAKPQKSVIVDETIPIYKIKVINL